MNLMKFFNRNYMIQNLKKSKSILAFFLGILPIISILSYLALAKNAGFSSITLEGISLVHYFGIYVIPIILSACLFGFVYKKKSVDFINSMPLSRKTIFTTNTITGVMLLLLMVILSGVGIYITSVLLNVIMPFRMIADYILMWSASYIFVFILSNIAMSISGNTMTQVIVTLILLFFIPFLTDYITAGNMYLGYDYRELCIEATTSSPYVEEVCNVIENIEETNYTTPYNNIRIILAGNWNNLYNMISLVKMIIASVIGYIVGKFLFLKRKMENNETSFKNLEMHNLIKTFTMFPVIAIISIMVPEINLSTLIIIFILIFLIIYFFIYDLITRKSISNIKKSLLHFCIILCVLFPICIAIHVNFHNYRETRKVNIKDIEVTGIQFSLNTSSLSDFEYLNIKDTKDIANILEESNNGVNGSSSPAVYKQMLIKTKNSDYKITTRFLEEDYNKMIENIKKLDDIQNATNLFDNNKVYAIGFQDSYMQDYTNDSKVIDAAKESINESSSCQDKYKFNKELTIYAYDNGKVISHKIDSCTHEALSEYVEQVLNNENNKVLDIIKNMSYTNAISKSLYFESNHNSFDLRNVINEDIVPKISDDKYRKNIYSFIKKDINDEFDIEKDYIVINVYLEGKKYCYYTNRTDELIETLGVVKEDLNDIN